MLHHAARYNSTSCVKVLLRIAPHHLDAVDVFNDTPLMNAVYGDNIDAANMLVRAGADVRTRNDDGDTAFDYAGYNEEMMEILNQHQQVSGIF